MGEDAIDKACKRCKIKAGSELEKLLRASSYQVYASGDWDIDKKLDAFLIEQSSNPLYADSLENRLPAPKPKASEKPTDVLTFSSREQFEEVTRAGLK